jgi:hypothetical protein
LEKVKRVYLFRGGCQPYSAGSQFPSACTSNPETGLVLTVEDLARALLQLSADDRARLAAILVGERTQGMGK